MKLRFMLVEDNLMFRKALRLNLEMYPDFEVVAEADTGRAALSALMSCGVDLVCIDVNLPDLNGEVLTGQILAQQPGIKIIALSAQTNFSVIEKMIHAGAQGYVDKINAGRDLYMAIETVCRDQIYLGPDVKPHDAADLIAAAMTKRRLVCAGALSD